MPEDKTGIQKKTRKQVIEATEKEEKRQEEQKISDLKNKVRTPVNLEEAISIWAKPQLGSQSPLFLYLISANLGSDFLLNDKHILTHK